MSSFLKCSHLVNYKIEYNTQLLVIAALTALNRLQSYFGMPFNQSSLQLKFRLSKKF